MSRALPLAILGVSLILAPNAYAGLGGDAADIQADADALHGTVLLTAGTLYDVVEISTDVGIHVREYLSRAGTVFAICWNGPVAPDLHVLLGNYFVSYATALATQDHLGLRRSVRLTTTQLVVESGGHLRAYVGRAYLPLRLPAAVGLAELH
jgi:hypothetical protein